MKERLKILLATDYSDATINAERYAVQLAKNINASLVFFHAYQNTYNPPSDPMEFAGNSKAKHQSEIKRLELHYEELLNSLQIDKSELFCEYRVRENSNAGKQIAKEAEESNSDFIIVGTHGVNGFRKFYFGSQSWDVIKKSNKPVFAIPQGSFFSGIKKIVFGIEYREGEIPNLNYLTHFAGMFDAEVTVLHITNYILTKRFEKEMFEKFRNEIRNKIKYSKLKIHLMVSENISEGVHKFCVENKTDLLVMSPKKSFLFEKYFTINMSMTRKTIFYTRVPLMTIPAFYNPEHEVRELVDAGEFINKENAAH